jgi:hypothetical protein
MGNRRVILGMVTMALSCALVFGAASVASAKSTTKHHKKTTTTTKAKHHKKKTTTTTTNKSSSGSGAVLKTCPTAAEISTAAGTTYPAPTSQKTTTGLYCNYNTETSGANLVLGEGTAKTTNAADVKEAITAQAKAQGVSATAVSGIGTAAYVAILKDATTNVDKQPTTILFVLSHGTYIDVTVDGPASEAEAVAKYVIAH